MPSSASPERVKFGRAVRELRLERRLSQEGLGHAAGLHRNHVGGIERGELNPSLENVFRLARGLGVEVSELLARAERMAAQP